jgi:hypothetical protein
MKATRNLFYVIGALFTARLVLLGCAPVIGVPSSRPLEAGGKEVGLGGGYVTDASPDRRDYNQGSTAHMYFRRAKNNGKLDVGTVLNLNAMGYLGIGGFGRYNICSSVNPDSRLSCGLQVDLGFLYAGASAPIAVQLFDFAWITSQPRISDYDQELAVFLPLGVSIANDSFASDISCGVVMSYTQSLFCGLNFALLFTEQ